MALTIIASYDIAEDDRRARIAALIQAWGTRIQRSVYLCQIEEQDLVDLVERIESLMDLGTDSLLVLRQCANCWESHMAVGQSSPRPDVFYWAVM